MSDKTSLNQNIDHPLQSSEWGEFRKKTGVKVIENSNFQVTIHRIPHTPWTIGYIPKGKIPNKNFVDSLKKIGQEQNCIFIQIEPNVQYAKDLESKIRDLGFKPAAHPLFTRYTFILDLTQPEETLLKHMHHKTRYNIKIAQKHTIKITEDNSDKAFEEYLKLSKETTKRQGFYAHTKEYHRKMWETLKIQNSKFKIQNSYDRLTAHLFLAKYNNEILTAWILFVFKDTLYYPYGASSSKHRETMASNLMMWEAIRFGKKLGLKKFDMWGSLGPNPDKNGPWYGFHRFKEGYGGTLVEFVGSFDLVLNPVLYMLYVISDKIRWMLLRLT